MDARVRTKQVWQRSIQTTRQANPVEGQPSQFLLLMNRDPEKQGKIKPSDVCFFQHDMSPVKVHTGLVAMVPALKIDSGTNGSEFVITMKQRHRKER